MVSLKKIRKSTFIIAISVIALSLLTIKTTYSYIFSVKSSTNVQTFTAGTLNISVSGSQKMNAESLMPAAEEDYPESLTDYPSLDNENNSYATLTIKNEGSLEAAFSVSINYDNDNLPDEVTKDACSKGECINFSYLNIGIYDSTHTKWINFASENGQELAYTSISSLSPNTDGSYPILNSTIKSQETINYQIFIWLSDTTPVEEIGKLAYLKLNVKSTPVGQALENSEVGE